MIKRQLWTAVITLCSASFATLAIAQDETPRDSDETAPRATTPRALNEEEEDPGPTPGPLSVDNLPGNVPGALVSPMNYISPLAGLFNRTEPTSTSAEFGVTLIDVRFPGG